MVVLGRHQRISHNPAIYFPIGHRQERLEKIESMGVKSWQMLLSESAEHEIEFPKAAPLRAEQCLFPPDVDTVVHARCYSARYPIPLRKNPASPLGDAASA